jgi:hypothetical protein
MLKLLSFLVLVVVIVGACHLILQAQTPFSQPAGPKPPDQYHIGRILIAPDMNLFAEKRAEADKAGNSIMDAHSHFVTRTEADERLSGILTQWRLESPVQYRRIMQKAHARLNDDTF